MESTVSMVGISSPFGRSDDNSGDLFDEYDEFLPENIPRLGRFLEGHDVLEDEDHIAFHQMTKELFEERGVYDMTFGYNLARLNLDTRHRNAGYRYAEDADDPSILWAEFTPTTPFCPQSDTLTKGSFRAWNGLADRHDYEMVRVRVDEMHHRADEINGMLTEMEESFRDGDGTVKVESDEQRGGGGSGCSQGSGGTTRGFGPGAPF